jgi:hypothetical protein
MIVRDGDWTLFDSDIKLGRHVWVRTNSDGSQTFRTDYQVDPTIEANKAMRNMLDPGWAGDYHKIASIPLNIYHDQLAEASRQDDAQYISKWLNDSDNAAWRVKEGRV